MIFDYSRLRELMRKRKMTLHDLADAIGVSGPNLCTKLTHGKPFTQPEILGICDALEIAQKYIVVFFFCVKTVNSQR